MNTVRFGIIININLNKVSLIPNVTETDKSIGGDIRDTNRILGVNFMKNKENKLRRKK